MPDNVVNYSSNLIKWMIQFVFTATPTTPTVQNVLINPSLIGSKNILITTNMVSQNSSSDSTSLKRKHEDEDDYDALWPAVVSY